MNLFLCPTHNVIDEYRHTAGREKAIHSVLIFFDKALLCFHDFYKFLQIASLWRQDFSAIEKSTVLITIFLKN